MTRYWRERLQKLVCEYNEWQPELSRKLQQFTDDYRSNMLVSILVVVEWFYFILYITVDSVTDITLTEGLYSRH